MLYEKKVIEYFHKAIEKFHKALQYFHESLLYFRLKGNAYFCLKIIKSATAMVFEKNILSLHVETAV